MAPSLCIYSERRILIYNQWYFPLKCSTKDVILKPYSMLTIKA